MLTLMERKQKMFCGLIPVFKYFFLQKEKTRKKQLCNVGRPSIYSWEHG